MKLHTRDETNDFIITLLTPESRIHLYYLNKEQLKKEHNIEIVKLFKELEYDAMELLQVLKYEKVQSSLCFRSS